MARPEKEVLPWKCNMLRKYP